MTFTLIKEYQLKILCFLKWVLFFLGKERCRPRNGKQFVASPRKSNLRDKFIEAYTLLNQISISIARILSYSYCSHLERFFATKMIFKAITAFSIIILLHAAYSAMEFNSIQKSTNISNTLRGEDNQILPIDIQIQALISLFLGIVGIIGNSKLVENTVIENLKKLSMDSIQSQNSMIISNHRGKYLFQ